MFRKIFNFVRLTWRLFWDRKVSLWSKIFLLLLPPICAIFPKADDIVPGLIVLDGFLLLGLCMIIFVALCPLAVVAGHRDAIDRKVGHAGVNLDIYRHPSEQRDLALGFIIILVVLTLGGTLAGMIGLALFAAGYLSYRIMRGTALGNAVQVTESQLPQLNHAFQAAQSHLSPVAVELFVTQNPTMNAFSYGYNEPYNIILTSGLVERLNEKEIQAVIGHELGHIHFGHVRLTNLMGGLGKLNVIGWIFYRWRRDCEYSSDAVALLASGGNLEPVVSSFLKLSSGLANIPVNLKSFLAQADGTSGRYVALAEETSDHPFINNRIKNLTQLKETRLKEAYTG